LTGSSTTANVTEEREEETVRERNAEGESNLSQTLWAAGDREEYLRQRERPNNGSKPTANKHIGRVEKNDTFVARLPYERREIPCHEVTDRDDVTRCHPHVVIGGFAKCGTSQLKSDLGACHPQIVAAMGEPRGLIVGDLLLHLDGIPVVLPEENVAFLEASPGVSSMSDGTLDLVSKDAPDTKFMFLVRDPVERAYSHFRMQLRAEARVVTRMLTAEQLQQCMADVALCYEEVLTAIVLPQTPRWRTCVEGATSALSLSPFSGGENVTEEWIRCVEEDPMLDWKTGLLQGTVVPSYSAVIERFRRHFRVLVIVAEDLFEPTEHMDVVAELLEFVGVDPVTDVAQCFAMMGNSKAGNNKAVEEELGINVTPISDRLSRLLTAMHRPDVAAMEEMLERNLPWLEKNNMNSPNYDTSTAE